MYYYFDDFYGYDEPLRNQLMQAEKKRILEGRPRFTWKNYNDSSWYDTINVGDKLIVSYKAYSDGAIEVRSADKSEVQQGKSTDHENSFSSIAATIAGNNVSVSQPEQQDQHLHSWEI